MKNKKNQNSESSGSRQYDHLGSESDFYSGGTPSEQPLYQTKHLTTMNQVRKTGRHKAVQGRRQEGVDPRERMALVAILKSMIMIFLLVIAFFLLWKGIKIYEESVFLKTEGERESSPVMQEMLIIEDFDIENQESRELFAERVDVWKETARLVRSADGLVKRNNFDQAIIRCQEALKLNPAHMGALERLGELYFFKGRHVEAINAYIRVLSVDPSREDLKIELIRVLNAHEDANAVIFMAQWYLEENEYNEEVGRHLANALFANEEFMESIAAYERVLKEVPGDVPTLEHMADAHIYLENYTAALETLEKLSSKNYRDPDYYQKIAICHAQLGHAQETVQTLGKAAHLFGQPVVIGWVQDPRLDPIREDRTFQSFADRVGGEEFRKWLEKVARTMDAEGEKDVTPQLTLPKQDGLDQNLLKPNK